MRAHPTAWLVAATILFLGGCEQSPNDDSSKVIADLEDVDAENRYDAAKELERRIEQNVSKDLVATALPALRKALRDADARVRYRAAKALSKLDGEAAPAVDELRATLTDQDPKTRYYVAKALAKIGKPARSAVPELIAALGDTDAEVRYFAAKALGKIEAEEALDALERAATASEVKVQEAAREAMDQIRGSGR
jgi:HEAT repeat protein